MERAGETTAAQDSSISPLSALAVLNLTLYQSPKPSLSLPLMASSMGSSDSTALSQSFILVEEVPADTVIWAQE